MGSRETQTPLARFGEDLRWRPSASLACHFARSITNKLSEVDPQAASLVVLEIATRFVDSVHNAYQRSLCGSGRGRIDEVIPQRPTVPWHPLLSHEWHSAPRRRGTGNSMSTSQPETFCGVLHNANERLCMARRWHHPGPMPVHQRRAGITRSLRRVHRNTAAGISGRPAIGAAAEKRCCDAIQAWCAAGSGIAETFAQQWISLVHQIQHGGRQMTLHAAQPSNQPAFIR